MGEIPVEKYYVTPQEVRDYMGITSTRGRFSDESLNNLIERAMKRVDYITNMVWNGRRRKVRYWTSLTRYEGGWLFGVGYRIYLPHMYLDEVTSLKVYGAGDYREFVGVYPEGRRHMTWWVQDIDGEVFIRKWLIKYTDEEVIIEYTYGRDDLPYYVKDLTLYYVVKELIRTSRYTEDMPEGAGIGLKEELASIDDTIQRLEARHTAIRRAMNYEDLGEVVS